MAMLLLLQFCFDIYSVPFFLLVEDLERNEGCDARPYFVTPSLMKILLEQDKQTKNK
jgi:hypothetical protein